MTASSLPTARPPWAVYAWCDDNYVYCEIPGDPPYIMKNYYSEGGMHKLLNVMRDGHRKLSPLHGEYKYAERPITKAKGGGEFTAEQRDRAASILRKLGMVKS